MSRAKELILDIVEFLIGFFVIPWLLPFLFALLYVAGMPKSGTMVLLVDVVVLVALFASRRYPLTLGFLISLLLSWFF